MSMDELQAIEEHWQNKYPHMDIRLWSNEYQTKYFGQISTLSFNKSFIADTVSELIVIGEQFLREDK